MAKFYGKVGYLSTEETSPDVYSEVLTERLYKGDVLRNQKRYQASEGLNDDVIVTLMKMLLPLNMYSGWGSYGK